VIRKNRHSTQVWAQEHFIYATTLRQHFIYAPTFFSCSTACYKISEWFSIHVYHIVFNSMRFARKITMLIRFMIHRSCCERGCYAHFKQPQGVRLRAAACCTAQVKNGCCTAQVKNGCCTAQVKNGCCTAQAKNGCCTAQVKLCQPVAVESTVRERSVAICLYDVMSTCSSWVPGTASTVWERSVAICLYDVMSTCSSSVPGTASNSFDCSGKKCGNMSLWQTLEKKQLLRRRECFFCGLFDSCVNKHFWGKYWPGSSLIRVVAS
jgi:hypothetical protein